MAALWPADDGHRVGDGPMDLRRFHRRGAGELGRAAAFRVRAQTAGRLHFHHRYRAYRPGRGLVRRRAGHARLWTFSEPLFRPDYVETLYHGGLLTACATR